MQQGKSHLDESKSLCYAGGGQTGEQGHRETGESPALNLVAFSVPAMLSVPMQQSLSQGLQEINILPDLFLNSYQKSDGKYHLLNEDLNIF